MSEAPSADQLQQEWLERLSDLVQTVKDWAVKLDWSARQIELTKEDSAIGKYQAPALLLQKEATRVLLEPIARSAPGVNGVVDLYVMPAYDDIANLYLVGHQWYLRYLSPRTIDEGTARETEDRPLTEQTFCEVLDEMSKHAVY
jgi:hypothetical protein